MPAAGETREYPLPDGSRLVASWHDHRSCSIERWLDDPDVEPGQAGAARRVWAQEFVWPVLDGLTGAPDPGRPMRELAAVVRHAARDPEAFHRWWLLPSAAPASSTGGGS